MAKNCLAVQYPTKNPATKSEPGNFTIACQLFYQ